MRTFLKPALTLFVLAGAVAQADTLVIEKVQQDAARELERPTRGMTMGMVASHFGEPQERIAAVGEPPIARWIYDDYIVYFEKDRVLHTVIRR